MSNRVTEMLGCQYPIIQGAMGIISNSEMVAAVSNAGGFGVLATAFADNVDIVREQVKATQKLTDKPFGANLFMMNPLSDQFGRLLAEAGVRAVTLSGGSPKVLIPLLHELGIKALVVVPTSKVAVSAESHGADAIVAEGSESGGIQGYQGASTIVLAGIKQLWLWAPKVFRWAHVLLPQPNVSPTPLTRTSSYSPPRPVLIG
jgi:enoyl-[acyl-carrier protein] reductase II